MHFVGREFHDAIGVITMNDPKHLNNLSTKLIEEVIETLDDFNHKKARVVIIRASKGVKVWSSGHNIKELPIGLVDPLTYDDPLRKVIRAIQKHPCPVIAMIEGSVWGGACEMAMNCDIIIASVKSTFAFTPARLGIPYDMVGILNFLKSVNLPLIKEFLFTAQPIPAKRVEAIGMINHAIENEQLEQFTFDMANTISQNAPLAISVIKEELRVLTDAATLSPKSYEKIQSGRKIVYDSKDYKEGIKAFFEKRKPVFNGK